MNRLIFKTITAWVVVLLASTSMGELSIRAEPVFEGQLRVGSSSPIRVEVSNSGPDARGTLVLDPSVDQVATPIDLPRGSTKTLLLYGAALNSPISVLLSTNRGAVRSTLVEVQFGDSSYNVLHISDAAGELAFLRTERTKNKNSNTETSTYSPLSVTSENVPDRVAGFRNISAIVMGEGAERLTNAQVAAVKQYVIGGGQLTVVGGAASPILSDPRWFTVLPIKNATVQNRNSSEIGKVFTNRVGDLTLGSRAIDLESGIVAAFHPYGFGEVAYLSINPLVEPFQNYEKRTAIFGKVIRPTRTNRIQQYLFDRSSVNQAGERSGSSGAVAAAAAVGGPRPSGPSGSWSYSSPEPSNPFTLQLPETSKVAWTLIAYFVVAIPVNFLILRKLKRLEWAWFSSPVISLAFAGILFQTASSLYSAKLSTVSSGVIIAQSGEPNANFLGSTQLFFPVAGYYDLKTSGIDMIDALSVADSRSPQNYYPSGEMSPDLKPVDTGEIQFPNATARNLEFQQFSYRQSIQATAKIRCFLGKTLRGYKFDINNYSPYALREVDFIFRGVRHDVMDLEPGKSVSVELDDNRSTGNVSDFSVDQISANDGIGFLTANVYGFRPGPQIGTELKSDPGISLIMGAEWTR